MAALAVRMVLSLCIVVGLLLLAARIAGKRYRPHHGSTIKVLQRQPLTRGSTVTVVAVGNRVLVLGTTEQQVRVLTELAPGEIGEIGQTGQTGPGGQNGDAGGPGRLYALPGTTTGGSSDFAQVLLEAQEAAPVPAPVGTRASTGRHVARHRDVPSATAPQDAGALAGSLLSPQTWRQALQALTGRAS